MERRVEPADVVIIEGILVLHMEEIRNLLNMRVFVDTDDDVRLARRIQRDVTHRGRDVGGVYLYEHCCMQITIPPSIADITTCDMLHCSGVIEQYTRFVKPAFDQFIGPSRRHADLIIPWQGSSNNLVAIDLITGGWGRARHLVPCAPSSSCLSSAIASFTLILPNSHTEHIKSKLQQHEMRRFYTNLEVIPSNFQTRGMWVHSFECGSALSAPPPFLAPSSRPLASPCTGTPSSVTRTPRRTTLCSTATV